MSERLGYLKTVAQRGVDTINGKTYTPPTDPATDGTWSQFTNFASGARAQVWGGAIHNGAKYFGVGGENDGLAQIWRNLNGSWANVTPAWPSSTRVPTLYSASDGYIYAGTGSNAGEVQIWRSQNGLHWTKYLNFGATVAHLFSILEFNGHLYCCVDRDSGPGEVYSSSNNWAVPVWTAPGNYAYTLHVHNGKLYVGTGYPAEVFEFNGTSWTQVSAFNNPSTLIVEALCSYRGDLIASMGREFWTASPGPCVTAWDGTTWQDVGETQPGQWRTSHNFNASIVVRDTLFVSMGDFYGGVSLWALADGENWTRVGGRPVEFGADVTGASMIGEWIYRLIYEPTENGIYVCSAVGSPIAAQPAVWRYAL